MAPQPTVNKGSASPVRPQPTGGRYQHTTSGRHCSMTDTAEAMSSASATTSTRSPSSTRTPLRNSRWSSTMTTLGAAATIPHRCGLLSVARTTQGRFSQSTQQPSPTVAACCQVLGLCRYLSPASSQQPSPTVAACCQVLGLCRYLSPASSQQPSPTVAACCQRTGGSGGSGSGRGRQLLAVFGVSDQGNETNHAQGFSGPLATSSS